MSTTKIKLDKDLVDRAKKYADEAGYSSVEEFISHTLESAIQQLDEAANSEEIKEKLKGLGYIA
jgi:metal-responsive CopG/Arc/MetJ family transcriptional regulator